MFQWISDMFRTAEEIPLSNDEAAIAAYIYGRSKNDKLNRLVFILPLLLCFILLMNNNQMYSNL